MSTSGKKKTCSRRPRHQLSPSKLQWSHSSRNEQVVCASTQEARRAVMSLLNPKLHRCHQKFQPVSLGVSSVLSTYYLQLFFAAVTSLCTWAPHPLTARSKSFPYKLRTKLPGAFSVGEKTNVALLSSHIWRPESRIAVSHHTAAWQYACSAYLVYKLKAKAAAVYRGTFVMALMRDLCA